MKLLKITIITIYIILLGFQLVLANLRSGDGDQLVHLDSQLQAVSSQNRQLQTLIYTRSSLTSIQEAAYNQGMIRLSTTQLTPLTVALSQGFQP